MAATTAVKATGFMLAVRRWAFKAAGFNKYGLYYDDLLVENDDVKEALKRLPKEVVDERNYRLLRATQADMQKIYLPKEMWTTFEDNERNRYLSPVVEQVEKERVEREKWESLY